VIEGHDQTAFATRQADAIFPDVSTLGQFGVIGGQDARIFWRGGSAVESAAEQ
jgi:hypothetical protein